MSENKFKFYEVVKIQPQAGSLDLSGLDLRKFDYQTLVGKKGVIMAMVQADNGDWLYEVSLDVMDEKASYTIREQDLISTGIMKKREDFYTGESIRVRVDPKTGEGEIVDDEEE